MKAVIYSRVSTQDQSTDNQIGTLKTWAASRNFEVIAVYQETDSAWRSGHQRELMHLIRDGQRRKFQVVIVWALDRLSREGALRILTLINNLNTWGIRVLSHQEAWTEAPNELSELLYALTGWVARMESQRRSERTKAGLERVRSNGKVLGRPKGSKDAKRRFRRPKCLLPVGV